MNAIFIRSAVLYALRTIYAVAALLVGVSCRSLPKVQESEVRDVSLVKLFANPEHYDGKKVRVVGYATLGFEVDRLYILPCFQKYSIPDSSLWLDIGPSIEENRAKYHDKIVLIEGRFANDMETGSIRDITRFEVWRNRDGTYPVREPRTPEENLKHPDPWGDY